MTLKIFCRYFRDTSDLRHIAGEILSTFQISSTVYIKPNMSTKHPMIGGSTTKDLFNEIIQQLAKKVCRIYVCESDTLERTADEAFRNYRYLQPSNVTYVNLSKLNRNECIEVTYNDTSFYLPSFITDSSVTLINIPCIKWIPPYGFSGALKNLIGLIVNKNKTFTHKYLPDILHFIYSKIRSNHIVIYDGTYIWKGSFDCGKVYKENLIVYGVPPDKCDEWVIKNLIGGD